MQPNVRANAQQEFQHSLARSWRLFGALQTLSFVELYIVIIALAKGYYAACDQPLWSWLLVQELVQLVTLPLSWYRFYLARNAQAEEEESEALKKQMQVILWITILFTACRFTWFIVGQVRRLQQTHMVFACALSL